MKVSERWLRQYVSFHTPSAELAEKLGMLGLETAGVDRLDERLGGFVVGKVISKDAHPNADRLSVCTVDVGKEHLTGRLRGAECRGGPKSRRGTSRRNSSPQPACEGRNAVRPFARRDPGGGIIGHDLLRMGARSGEGRRRDHGP